MRILWRISKPVVCCFQGLAYNLDTYDWPRSFTTTPQVPKNSDGASLDWYYFLTGNVSFPKHMFDLESGFSLDFKNYGWEDLGGYRLLKQRFLYYLKND